MRPVSRLRLEFPLAVARGPVRLAFVCETKRLRTSPRAKLRRESAVVAAWAL